MHFCYDCLLSCWSASSFILTAMVLGVLQLPSPEPRVMICRHNYHDCATSVTGLPFRVSGRLRGSVLAGQTNEGGRLEPGARLVPMSFPPLPHASCPRVPASTILHYITPPLPTMQHYMLCVCLLPPFIPSLPVSPLQTHCWTSMWSLASLLAVY